MSVRDGLLAILTLGPAYGLQLHAELASRTPHRKPVNAGQIYGTLDRLVKSKHLTGAGTTSDALPLYALTSLGRHTADQWMRVPATAMLPDWTEMLDQVLLTSSIDARLAKSLAEDYRRWWEKDRLAVQHSSVHHGGSKPAPDAHLALVAREAMGVAALAWLGAAISELSDFDTFRPLSENRPKRGRKTTKPAETIPGLFELE